MYFSSVLTQVRPVKKTAKHWSSSIPTVTVRRFRVVTHCQEQRTHPSTTVHHHDQVTFEPETKK